jgi:hypothetical protein
MLVDVGKASWANMLRHIFHSRLFLGMNIEVQQAGDLFLLYACASNLRSSDRAWRIVGSVRYRDSIVR